MAVSSPDRLMSSSSLILRTGLIHAKRPSGKKGLLRLNVWNKRQRNEKGRRNEKGNQRFFSVFFLV